jgi:hypothetical protein
MTREHVADPALQTAAFAVRWLAFVRGWTAEPDPQRRLALLDQLLSEGLDATVAANGPDPHADAADALVDPADRMTCEHDLITAATVFDDFGYMWHNRELHWHFCGHHEGVRHFVRHGWRELRNPSPDFDVWWYWTTYLNPAGEDVNPLVHYLVEGRRRGLEPLPPVLPVRDVPPVVPGRPRRACLFAGFDGDGIVDDYVVQYVAELSRHADVYYLADCSLEEGELDKLAPYTQGRWTIRHGRYDFGSYAMLARDLVGWETLEGYDEVLLTNDSSYLLRPLDEVFATMDARPAHWWGLQATDDDFLPRDQERLGRRLRVQDLVAESRETRPWRMSDSFHVGSYFLVLRSEVLADPELRRRLETVAQQSDKNSIIRKYEIGISAYLTLAGYHVETFVDGVLPFHPIYRESVFELIQEGFPFVKRQFLHENPFHVVNLHRWKERLLALTPGADVDAMERNLWRVSPSFNLNRALSVRKVAGIWFNQEELIGPDNFGDLERFVPRFDHWWVFPVNPSTGRVDGHARAVFEVVRHDPTIKKVIVGPTENPGIGGANVAAVLGESQGAQWYALRAGVIVVNEGPRVDLPHPLVAHKHRFVDVGHATAMRRFGTGLPHGSSPEDELRRNQRLHDLDLTRVVVTASEESARAVGPLIDSPSRPETWVTGSPRADLLLRPQESLAPDLRAQLDVLRRARRGRRLVVWAPAERETCSIPELTGDQMEWLRDTAARHGAVVGVRPPRRDRPGDPVAGFDAGAIRAAGLLVLSHRVLPDTEMVLREAAALISDYTSDLVDYLVLDRPSVAFVPDEAAFRAYPGLVHDVEAVTARPPCRDWAGLQAAFGDLCDEPTDAQRATQARVRDALHDHVDGRSAARLVRRVQSTYLPIAEWLEEPEPQA